VDRAIYPRPSLPALPLGAEKSPTRTLESSDEETIGMLEVCLRDLHVNPMNIIGKRSATKLVLSAVAFKSGLPANTPGAAGDALLNIINAARTRNPKNWEPYEVRVPLPIASTAKN
jgi:hypothetical protein